MNIFERKLKAPIGLTVQMDDDVKLVLEFILLNIRSSKRISVANAVKQLAPLIFAHDIEANHYEENRFIPIRLSPANI
jgi:hypothetical protein